MKINSTEILVENVTIRQALSELRQDTLGAMIEAQIPSLIGKWILRRLLWIFMAANLYSQIKYGKKLT